MNFHLHLLVSSLPLQRRVHIIVELTFPHAVVAPALGRRRQVQET